MRNNNQNFKNTVHFYKSKIDHELELFLNNKISDYAGSDPVVIKTIKNIKEFTMRGGKRIRPLLVLFSYMGLKKISKKEENEIIKAAISIELMESFLLIHDDIMDNDSLRRGGPTIHKIYETSNPNLIDKNMVEYGKSMAIILGDVAQSLGTEALLESQFSSEKKISALKIYQETIKQTCYGQILDIDLGLLYNSKELKEQIIKKTMSKSWIDAKTLEIKNMHLMKTAIYSFVAPMKIGYVLGGANNKKLKEIESFMIPLGKAFQIKDDILGIYGDEKKIGKTPGSDIREGKITLLILKALEKSDIATRKKLIGLLGKNINKTELEFIRKTILETGSLDYSVDLANEYIDEAKSVFNKIRLNKESKDFFYGLMDFVIERNK